MQIKTYSLSFIIGLLGFALLSQSCEYQPNYEEGPFLSPYLPKDRVTNTWIWSYYLDNETNLTGVYQDSMLMVKDDQTLKLCALGDTTQCREGNWHLVSKNLKLQLIFGEQARAYDIKLLEKREMWLDFSSTDSNLHVYWELVPFE
ncbi:MAG: hypothetical protein AAFR61_16640 [Bacteroidota bacterium]